MRLRDEPILQGLIAAWVTFVAVGVVALAALALRGGA